MPIRIFNANNHPIFRKGIIELIKETPNMIWIGSAKNGKEAIDKILKIKPDIALLDLEMPQVSGLEIAEVLIKKATPTKVIILTPDENSLFCKKAIEIGVKGCLTQKSTECDILNCIQLVYEGNICINPNLLEADNEKNEILNSLSKHELNILKLIAQKKTTVEIADKLFISAKTVSNHRTNISKKLKLRREQNGLLKWAIEHQDSLI